MSWIGKYYEKDAVLVQILLEAGAVPFVQTNVTQTLMVSAFDSVYTTLTMGTSYSGLRVTTRSLDEPLIPTIARSAVEVPPEVRVLWSVSRAVLLAWAPILEGMFVSVKS